jgi:hypothetical protein
MTEHYTHFDPREFGDVKKDPGEHGAVYFERPGGHGGLDRGEQGPALGWTFVKKPKLIREAILRAVVFLEKRREHARVRDNKEWTEEYENVLAVLRGLAGL